MRPTIICLTPVKNEAWILDRFLKAVSLWADYIIIADQMSTDGSREIALSYPKVKLIDNNSELFNEPERQKLLIDEARKIKGPRLLVTLDADEMFSPNVFTSPEWGIILNAKPGTIFNLQWANFKPDLKFMWYSEHFPRAYMDDESEFIQKEKIHTARVPISESSPIIAIDDIKLIHLQYINWERMQNKHRWYQCFERITYPEKSPLIIFRMYHHMYEIKNQELTPIPKSWIAEYIKFGIDLHQNLLPQITWWEEKVLDYFDKYGVAYFRKINIWDVNWVKIAKLQKRKDPFKYKDPRTYSDKMIQLFLKATQPHQHKYIIRKIEKVIKKYFEY